MNICFVVVVARMVNLCTGQLPSLESKIKVVSAEHSSNKGKIKLPIRTDGMVTV